jgi:paraquat-inducible protein A
LTLFIPAMTWPIMGIRKLGFTHQTGLIDGMIALIRDGDVLLGVLLIVCSFFLPVGKLIGLLLLTTRGRLLAPQARFRLIRAIEWTSRFSVLDLLLVAILIAVVKVGDLVTVHVGPGLLTFAAVVFLSLLSGWAFDHDSVWKASDERSNAG